MTPNFSPFVFVNGLLFPQMDASLPVNDLAILRGYGFFDFFLVKNGQPLFFDDHWERLQQSAAGLNLHIPFLKEDALRMVHILHTKMPYPLAGVRITITGGSSLDGYLPGGAPNSLLTLQQLDPFPATLAPTGIGLMTHEFQRSFSTVKSIDYIMGMVMVPVAKQKGFQELLYVKDGLVSECPRSNVFAITRDDVLITPDAGVLKGITRKRILKHAVGLVKVEERPVQLQELLNAKEVWISSTTKGIWTVANIDGHLIEDGKPGKYAAQIYKLLLEEMKSIAGD